MGDFQQYFDIILFAMVAAFLVLRLRSVLGRRTGNEQRRDIFSRRADDAADKVVPFPDRSKPLSPPLQSVDMAASARDGLERIKEEDPAFDAAEFLKGARGAFETIVTAFAHGDSAALRPLLSDAVFQPFSAAITEREAAKESVESRSLRLDASRIVEAALEGDDARIGVKFVSQQILLTYADNGSLLEGNSDHPVQKTDYWTFTRNIRSANPNWTLVATTST